ncbi:uncharacterized protein LOC114729462 [Neltuma alba]|uniref:uncharacterized protein LOC114729462 n=1 Tax=Neltuma alba TaxID=207710 RepID=UPI0010A4D874|nr:uncharacterized protein LOC114729462 [Prosopis alba]
MGTVETRSKTSMEGSSLAPANDKPRGSESESRTLKEALAGSKGGSRETGVRFSSNGNGGLGDDGEEVVKSRAVAAKTPIQRGREVDTSNANDCQGLGDSEMNGVSSLLKMRESGRNVNFSHVGGSDSADKLNCNYASTERRTRAADFSSGDGSLGVGVEKRPNRKKRRESKENNERVVTIEVPIVETSENKDSEDVDASDEEYGLSVGDFVWGKIKSHPWWPGRIYDPSDASDYALKLRQKNRLLVAYFGDCTFAWCHPSQLKPFEENFEDMVKQSNSKSFVNAVQDAVMEIGRLLDMKMTNSWFARKSKAEVASLLAKNSGIKDGILVPENGIEKLSTVLFDPVELLSRVKKMAEVIAISSVLELEILKARLSAFYLYRGGYKLPNYHAPQPIPGLEDNGIDETVDKGNRKETTVQGPSDEEYSLPVSPKRGEASHPSGTRLHHRRKQKSIAEIIREDNDLHTKVNEGVENEVVNPGKITGSSGRKKRKSLEDTMTTTQAQKTLGSPPCNDQNVPSSETVGRGANQTAKEGTLSHLKKKKDDMGNNSAQSKTESHVAPVIREENLNRKEGKEQIEKGSLSRERKKSKYLSPPFTTPSRGQRKGEKETSVKDSGKALISEQITRAAGELLGTSTPLKNDGQAIQETLPKEPAAVQENIPKEPAIDHDLTDKLNSQAPEEKNETIDLKKIQASPGEVISKVRSAALNPQVPKDINFIEKIVGFISVFRSSMYRQGSFFTLCNKRQPGRKRKNPESEPGTLRKSQNLADYSSPNHESEKRKRRKKMDTVSGTPKEKLVAENKMTGRKGGDENVSTAALVISFGSGTSLPSKSELITLYSQFGALNEAETDVFCTSYTARVCFLKTSDAEVALNHSKNVSPFGSSDVKFELGHCQVGSKSGEHGGKPKAKASTARKKDRTPAKPSTPHSPVMGVSNLDFIKQKLEAMSTVLEGSEGMSSDIKKKIESDIKGLLESVRKMAESSSS